MGRSKLLLHRIVQSSKQLHFIIIAFSIDLIIKMPKKSNVRANTMPKNPKNDHNQQENSKSSPTPREISDPANKPQKDNLRTSISIQVGVVNNILDDAFKTSNESIIEKIVELTSNRRDILARIIAKNKETVEQFLRLSIMKDGDVVSKESRKGIVKKLGTPLECSKSELEREEDQEIVKQGLKESTVNDNSPLCELKAKKTRGRKAPRRKVAKKLFTAVKCSKSELEREDQEIVKQVLEKSTVNDKDSLGKTNAKKDVRKAPTGRRDATKLLTKVKCSKSELEREDQEIVKQVLKESTVNNKDRLGNTSAKKVGRPRKDSKISLANQAQKKKMIVWLERNDYQIFLGKSAVITEGSITDDFLPLNLKNFEALDTQGPAEKTRIHQPYATKVAKTSKSEGTNSDEPGKNKKRRRLTYNQEEENHSYQKTQNDLQREFTLYSSDEEMSSKESNHMETSDAEEDMIFSDMEEETMESKVELAKGVKPPKLTTQSTRPTKPHVVENENENGKDQSWTSVTMVCLEDSSDEEDETSCKVCDVNFKNYNKFLSHLKVGTACWKGNFKL